MERIGKYHVIRAAGSGGFGTVYEGYDVELSRNVAIKICSTEDENQLERFRREARIVSQLKHRNIALVYDFGYDEAADLHYLVEEFLSGADLDKKLDDRDRLPASLRLHYLVGIAQGLEFVHDKGLIHRDLSPRNIRVLHDQTIKLMDFGLAKDVTDATLTLVGDNFGTVGYTAPEQVTGMRLVDHRTDIFSFGVVAYELLTYTNPFMADNMGVFLRKIHHYDPKPLIDHWPQCPPALSDTIDKCLKKTPEERFDSCTDILPILKKALRYLRDNDVPAPYAPTKERAESDAFLIPSDVLPGSQQTSGAAIYQSLGEAPVDGTRLTDLLPGPQTADSTHSRSEIPVGAVTEPLSDDLSWASDDLVPDDLIPASDDLPSAPASVAKAKRLPAYLAAGAAAVALAIVVFATLPRGDTAAETAPPTTASPATPQSMTPQLETTSSSTSASAPSAREPGPSAFSLHAQNAGSPEGPAVDLLAALPRELAELSHCYIVRTPAWSYGAKVRRNCDGDAFRHTDKVELEAGRPYTYKVQVADPAGTVLAESLVARIVAGE